MSIPAGLLRPEPSQTLVCKSRASRTFKVFPSLGSILAVACLLILSANSPVFAAAPAAAPAAQQAGDSAAPGAPTTAPAATTDATPANPADAKKAGNLKYTAAKEQCLKENSALKGKELRKCIKEKKSK